MYLPCETLAHKWVNDILVYYVLYFIFMEMHDGMAMLLDELINSHK